MELKGEKKSGLLLVLLGIVASLLAAFIIMGIGAKMTPSLPVLVADMEINLGDPLEKSMFKEVKLPEAGMPEEAVRPTIDFSNLIASKKMFPGDVLRAPALIMLDNPDPSVLSARLKALDNNNLRAMEIPVESVVGMIGGMKAGDYIDVISVFTMTEEDPENDKPEQIQVSEIIIRGAPVIGVRPPVDGPGALVVAFTEEQTKTYALNREKGRIYVSLRPFGHKEIAELAVAVN